MDGPGDFIDLRGEWPASDAAVPLANQIAIQLVAGDSGDSGAAGLLMTFGQMLPPTLSGDQEDQWKALRELEKIPIHLISRVMINRQLAGQLIGLLSRALEVWDTHAAGSSKEGSDG